MNMLERGTVSTLLSTGAGPMLEFMLEPDAGKLAEQIVAFANSVGGTIVVGTCFVALNLLSDILYRLLDPRAK